MIACKDCGALFEEPAEYRDDPSQSGIGLQTAIEVRHVCPYCGSGAIEDARKCPSCGEYHNGDGLLCKECAGELSDMLGALRKSMELGQVDFDEAIADHFGW